jgi:predicted aminopeptidase
VKRSRLILTILIFAGSIFSLFFLFDGPYLAGQGFKMLMLRRGMQNVEELVENGSVDEETEEFFELTAEIRRFAFDELGLEDTKSYRSYIETERDHIVDVVSAVRSDSLERYTKWYPLVGRVFYRGYFTREAAETFAAKRKKNGYDVLVREVDAYSSLGLISDPLYSYMKSYGDYALAEMIIHEMVHSSLWLPGHNEFNEEIAVFIGREGAMEFIRRRGAEEHRLQEIAAHRRDYESLLVFFRRLYRRLETEYETTPTAAERLRIKEEILSEEKRSFEENYSRLFSTERYRRLLDIEWNHALIDLYLQYGAELDLYYRLLEQSGGDIGRVTERILSIDKKSKDPRAELATFTES